MSDIDLDAHINSDNDSDDECYESGVCCSCCGTDIDGFSFHESLVCSGCGTPYCSDECADAHWTDEHHRLCWSSEHCDGIGFEIYLPPGRLVSRVVGAKNMVHQYITQLAVEDIERKRNGRDYFTMLKNAATGAGLARSTTALEKLDSKRLIGGVIWNDVPSRSAEDKGAKYAITAVSERTAKSVLKSKRYKGQTYPSTRFRFNPSNKMLARLAVVFVKVKFGKTPIDNVMYQSHFGDDTAQWHSMAPENNKITVETVVSRIIKQAMDWWSKAVRNTDIFQIGHIVHMLQDSGSMSHAIRISQSAGKHSVLKAFQSFATQSPAKHANADSMTAFLNSPFKQEIIDMTRFFLEKFLQWLEHAAKNRTASSRNAFKRKQAGEIRNQLQTKFVVTTSAFGKKMAGGCESAYCKTTPDGKSNETSKKSSLKRKGSKLLGRFRRTKK